MKESIPVYTFYISIGIGYLFLLSYASDKQLLGRFGLAPDAHSRSFHQHITQGFQIAVHPMFMFVLFTLMVIALNIPPIIFIVYNEKVMILAATIATAFLVGWINARSTSIMISKYAQPFMSIKIKSREEPVNGIVILQDSIKAVIYINSQKLTLVVPWAEISEVLVDPCRVAIEKKPNKTNSSKAKSRAAD